MHEREIKVLWRGGVLLAAASLFRLGAGSTTSGSLPAGPSVLDSLTAESAAVALVEERRARPLEPGERIDPNRADAVDLARLPGIGPTLAERIVDHRGREGPFATIQDLTNVPGIGPRSLERMAGLLEVAPRAPRRGERQPPKESTRAGVGPVYARGDPRAVLSALNGATAAELEGLPGVGSALAARIVEFRAGAGRLRSAEQLLEVPGIGPGRMAAIERALSSWAASLNLNRLGRP